MPLFGDLPPVSDLMFRHLDKDVRYKDAVCIVVSRYKAGGRTIQERGTGFLVKCAGTVCIMTNNHVLPDRTAAEECSVTFVRDAVTGSADKHGAPVRLCPSEFFITSPKPRPSSCNCFRHRVCLCRISAKCDRNHLDYTLCAIKGPALRGREPMPIPCNNPLPSKGSDIFILHPTPTAGVLRCTKEPVQATDPYMLAFVTNTPAGSSGSPIFNRLHELAGVHRAGGPCQLYLGDKRRPDSNARSDVEAVHVIAMATAQDELTRLMPANGLIVAADVGICHAIPIRTIAQNIRLQLFAKHIVDDLLEDVLQAVAAPPPSPGGLSAAAAARSPRAPAASSSLQTIHDALLLSRCARPSSRLGLVLPCRAVSCRVEVWTRDPRRRRHCTGLFDTHPINHIYLTPIDRTRSGPALVRTLLTELPDSHTITTLLYYFTTHTPLLTELPDSHTTHFDLRLTLIPINNTLPTSTCDLL